MSAFIGVACLLVNAAIIAVCLALDLHPAALIVNSFGAGWSAQATLRALEDAA